MAVQAQHPSNILLQNRGMQEGKSDYSSFQQQQTEGERDSSRFLHHHLQSPQNHIFFNNSPVENSGTNSRKRGREVNMNQFIDLTNIQSRNVDVSTGLRLSFNDQKQQQNHSVSPQSSEDLSTQINQQTHEIEHFLQLQGEVLRRTLAEKRQRHYNALLSAAEELVARKLRDKDLEAEKAFRRRAELETRAAQLSTEVHIWQSRAREQEAEAAALQAQLQHAIVRGSGSQCIAPAEEGRAAVVGETEDAESAYIDPERVVVASGPGCKACGKRVASVVLLPCRHLCVCIECDDVVQACPLCLSFRSSSIEVFMS